MLRRMEIKYLIDRSTRSALEKDLSALMRPDAHSNQEGGYLVRSLYFDTTDFMAYHDKLAGSAVRHKLRVRAYGEDPSQSPVIRLEVKSRYLSFIHKITVDIPKEAYREIEPAIRHRALPPKHYLENESVSKEFFRIQRQYNMEPKIIIQYRRQAFERKEMSRVRVNFDDELLATRDLDLLGPLRGARRLLKYGSVIFEIKVDGGMPFWLHTLISKYNLWNQAVSKYCHAVRSEARFSCVARSEE
ncbi:MAG: polyphosphate polymerase domain-containing protein [bacterium]